MFVLITPLVADPSVPPDSEPVNCAAGMPVNPVAGPLNWPPAVTLSKAVMLLVVLTSPESIVFVCWPGVPRRIWP